MSTTTRTVSTMFQGPEVKIGSVMLEGEGLMRTLTLSDDFVVPDAPAPHWRVVNAAGEAHLLQRLVTVGDRFHSSIPVPAFVGEVSKVQIYCAFAEVVLGEVTFESL